MGHAYDAGPLSRCLMSELSPGLRFRGARHAPSSATGFTHKLIADNSNKPNPCRFYLKDGRENEQEGISNV